MYKTNDILNDKVAIVVDNNRDYNALMDFAEDTVEAPTPRKGFTGTRAYNLNGGAKCTVADKDYYLDKGFSLVRFSKVDLGV